MSSRYDVYIAGTKRLPVFFKFTEDIMLPSTFELEIEAEAEYGNPGDRARRRSVGNCPFCFP
jgi:hypothetical protein